MYEDNKKFSLTSLLCKIIIVIIFVLFVMWLLSYSNKGISNSLDVLTDRIFAENMAKMKEVGKEYFTTERLPQEIGDIKSLSLKKMYDKKLLLELKDKNGNSCSATDSYVSIEKFENEYQMEVHLECGDQSESIIVIMGCYNYCKTDICELKQEETKQIEYEYKKVTNGRWTDYGNWSEWSKVVVTANDYRQIETKKVTEPYTYNKQVSENQFVNYNLTCPTGYELKDGKCIKTITNVETIDAVCPAKAGYSVSRNGFSCTYTKNVTEVANAVCPTKTGYTVSRNGFSCTYTKSSTDTVNPTCPATYGNGTYTSISNYTCYYKVTSESCTQVASKVQVPRYCGSVICGSYYETKYTTSCTPVTSTVSTTATCPAGYSNVNGTCTKNTTDSITDTATCPSGYNKVNGTCTKNATDSTTDTATCPTGYNKVDNRCTKSVLETTTDTATCPTGYNKVNGTCSKTVSSIDTKNVTKLCPSGSSERADKTGCNKVVTNTISVTENREVTYYRYRIRQYVGGSVDYKWSTSKEDRQLLNAGYTLTGRTR